MDGADVIGQQSLGIAVAPELFLFHLDNALSQKLQGIDRLIGIDHLIEEGTLFLAQPLDVGTGTLREAVDDPCTDRIDPRHVGQVDHRYRAAVIIQPRREITKASQHQIASEAHRSAIVAEVGQCAHSHPLRETPHLGKMNVRSGGLLHGCWHSGVAALRSRHLQNFYSSPAPAQSATSTVWISRPTMPPTSVPLMRMN